MGATCREHVVYGLADIETPSDVRYVGSTYDMSRRMAEHVRGCVKGTSLKDRWLRALIAAGRVPVMVAVAHLSTAAESREVEGQVIRRFRALGLRLTNANDWGTGQRKGWTPSAAHRAAVAAKQRGRKRPPEAVRPMIEAARAANKGRRFAPEVRARMGSKPGVPKSPEHRAKIAATLRGRKFSEEHIANLCAAQSATWTPERRAAHGVIQRARQAREREARRAK